MCRKTASYYVVEIVGLPWCFDLHNTYSLLHVLFRLRQKYSTNVFRSKFTQRRRCNEFVQTKLENVTIRRLSRCTNEKSRRSTSRMTYLLLLCTHADVYNIVAFFRVVLLGKCAGIKSPGIVCRGITRRPPKRTQ